MLRTTFKDSVVDPLPPGVTPSAVLSFLQSAGNLIDLSPIVTKYEFRGEEQRDGMTVQVYDCWEKIDVLPKPLAGQPWSPKREIHFVTAFHFEGDQGCTTYIDAPLGLVSKAVYRVRREGVNGSNSDATLADGQWVLDEEVESSVFFALRPLVEGQLVDTRKIMHKKLFEAVSKLQTGPTTADQALETN